LKVSIAIRGVCKGGGTGVLPSPQWLHDSPQEAILSAENSENLWAVRGRAPPRTPLGHLTALPRLPSWCMGPSASIFVPSILAQ